MRPCCQGPVPPQGRASARRRATLAQQSACSAAVLAVSDHARECPLAQPTVTPTWDRRLAPSAPYVCCDGPTPGRMAAHRMVLVPWRGARPSHSRCLLGGCGVGVAVRTRPDEQRGGCGGDRYAQRACRRGSHCANVHRRPVARPVRVSTGVREPERLQCGNPVGSGSAAGAARCRCRACDALRAGPPRLREAAPGSAVQPPRTSPELRHPARPAFVRVRR